MTELSNGGGGRSWQNMDSTCVICCVKSKKICCSLRMTQSSGFNGAKWKFQLLFMKNLEREEAIGLDMSTLHSHQINAWQTETKHYWILYIIKMAFNCMTPSITLGY